MGLWNACLSGYPEKPSLSAKLPLTGAIDPVNGLGRNGAMILSAITQKQDPTEKSSALGDLLSAS